MIYIIVTKANFKTENSVKTYFIKKTIDQIRFLFLSFPFWVGFLGVRFEGGGIKLPLPLCLKLVRTILKTLNLARKYTPICSFRNIPFSIKVLLILLVLGFFSKKSTFFGENSTFTQNNSVKAVLEIF